MSQPVMSESPLPDRATPATATPDTTAIDTTAIDTTAIDTTAPDTATAAPLGNAAPAAPRTSRRALFSKAVLAGTVALFTRVAVATPAEASEESEETAQGVVLAKTKSIPLHGGKILKGKYVVTQPSKGVFKCFTAKCTHQGCTVATISGGTINCPCHGSRFSIADGHVVNGPATRSLPRKKIKVKKGVIRLA